MGSRSSSGHSRRGSNSGSQRDTGSSSNSFPPNYKQQEPEPPPVEEGIEVLTGKSQRYLSTSHAGVVRRNEGYNENADLTRSQHQSDDLEAVPEAAGHLERPSRPSIELSQQMTAELRGFAEFKQAQEEQAHFELDRSDRMDGSYRLDRSVETSRPANVRPSSMSVVSDVSNGDRQVQYMSQLSFAQDSGSQMGNINSSQKSMCSFNPGSKRMAEKRAHMIRSGVLTYDSNIWEQKKLDDENLSIDRWGGRKNYSSQHDRRRKKGGTRKKDKDQSEKSFDTKMSSDSKQDRSVKSNVDPHLGLGLDSIRTTAEIKGGHGFHDLWGFAYKREYLEYEELIKEDKTRELVASYCEEPFWKIIFHFRGTVFRVIIEDILFWLTLATYLSIRIKFRLEPTDADLQVDYENLSSNLVYVGGFLLFFLVFYVNQNHHRYFELHQDSMVIMGRVNDMATLVKAILPMERARRINRLMNAAHVAMYTGLSSTYEKENFFDPLEARFALFTDEELYRVVDEIDVDCCGPKAVYEIISWIMCDIRDAQIHSFIDTNEAMQMREQLLVYRSTIAKVFVTTTLPIPFFYVHFLSILTTVYLPLFAVVVGFETGAVGDSNTTYVAEIVSGLVVFLQALFVIGLRILGQQLSDPYGGDLIDLQISRYVNMILNGSNQILAAKRLNPPSVETELRLQLKMSSLGPAFEYDTDDETINQY